MKTWEMIKALTENPKLIFVRSDNWIKVYAGSDGYLTMEFTDKNFSDEKPTDLFRKSIHDEWKVVHEPITFLEAVKAYSKGNKIRVVVEGENGYERCYKNCFTLSDNKNETICTDEILNGKWYIEQ